ncbi:DNA-binding protein [Clostridium sp. D2Q-14]|uniref:PPC domain-containing DNA-binding protein n=1 Tax=Anaeromonas gelatinilytica TaxID=2683194 RepID=UPI00193BDB42|nr:PPC domain-containing DNA-binding protein [Anaeromonas gelatinilytica]MBS4535052.1 DNA-binding protein [Anaeromonas gelatinilytica]
MEYKKFGSKYVIRLDRGEEIVESIKRFIQETNVKLANVTGIGAADKVTIGLYDVNKRKYISNDYEGEYEITALIGNISSIENEPYLHLHITIGDEKNRAFGGHLNSASISATCEIFVDVYEGELDRIHDDNIGLNILKF